MDRCIVMTARRYDFKDEATGRRIEGVTLTYVTGDVEDQQDYRGRAVMSIPAPADVWHDLQALPGVYAVDFKQPPNGVALAYLAGELNAGYDELARSVVIA